MTLTLAQAPPHSHGGGADLQGVHAHNIPTPANLNAQGGPFPVPIGALGWYGQVTDEQGGHYHNISTDTQGGGAAHTNVQPGALGLWIIKATTF